MASQMQSLITVVVDGRPLGIFDSRSGGETTAELSKYRPGGMRKQKTRRGLPETGELTVSRENEYDRDNDLAKWLRTRVGAADMIVNSQPLDANGAPFGRPTTWTGVLQSVNPGDEDSNSNDGRTLELGMTVSEAS